MEQRQGNNSALEKCTLNVKESQIRLESKLKLLNWLFYWPKLCKKSHIIVKIVLSIYLYIYLYLYLTKCEENQKTAISTETNSSEINTIINSNLKSSFNPDILLYLYLYIYLSLSIYSGTRIGQASECFVYWKDPVTGDTWGLNFTSPIDAKQFKECCVSSNPSI